MQMPQNTSFTRVLGLMSGTSLDGLDMALCEFNRQDGQIVFKILKAQTLAYSADWKQKLASAHTLSAEAYFALHATYGAFMAAEVKKFLVNAEKPAAIASHGHTIFHQPTLGFSSQLGCGATLAAHTGITTVCDFRSTDVALGGQGAPLVPIGDALLFSQYEACLNIGGISNISMGPAENRRAYDIGIANMLLNYLAEKSGQAYDKGGEMARAGKVLPEIFSDLENLEYYKKTGARSLGREWFEREVKPLFENGNTNDLLATATEHVAARIAADLNTQQVKNVLITGGGAFNTFLLERIKTKTSCELILPSAEIINFKEALIFALLGHLRLNDQNNALASVTGASADNCGGAVYRGS